MLTLITGGARSGKSRFAQSLCAQYERVAYIATARASDDEMRARIDKHQRSRPSAWVTVEEPLAVSEVVAQYGSGHQAVLIDCVTLWLSNLLYEWRNDAPETVERNASERVGELIAASSATHVLAVTNEVGSGIVPEHPVSRHFRDVQGFVNQALAAASETVYLLVAGVPICIKSVTGATEGTKF